MPSIDPSTEVQTGIVIDAEGYFVAALRWSAGTPRPRLHSKRSGWGWLKDKSAGLPPSADARWVDGAWMEPPQQYWIVDAAGRCRGSCRMWPGRIKQLPEGRIYTTTEPPKARGRKPIYDPASDTWSFPRRVALVNEAGEVTNVALENPREDQPDVEVPKGFSRFDDRDWPTDEDGEKVGLQHKLDKKAKKWKRRPIEASGGR